MDVACRDGDPFSSCQHKFQYLVGISWEFESTYEDDCEDKILLKNQLGYFTLVSRNLDGKRGYIDFGSSPFPAGKCRILAKSHAGGVRRCRTVLWVEGEDDWSSM